MGIRVFKIYFSSMLVQGKTIQGKAKDCDSVICDPLIIWDVYCHLLRESLSHYIFFCQRFNFDFDRFKPKLEILEVESKEKFPSLLKHFHALGGTEGSRTCVPNKHYRILLISSGVSVSLGFVFIRSCIWV